MQQELQDELPGIDPVDLKPHDFKLARPPSMQDSGYMIFYGSCLKCGGDVEYFESVREMRCLQCSFNQHGRWERSA